MKRFIAFTLAETLIVIGVIGIVSALTLPNLNSSTGDKEKVAKVKKVYQNLTDAFGRAEAVYGPFEEWFINDANIKAKTKRAGERITEFMKVSKTCGSGEGSASGCFTSGDAHLLCGAGAGNMDSSNTYRIITADGSSISVYVNDSEMYITVDIDGPTRGKYTFGQDIFDFFYDKDKKLIIPLGYYDDFDNLIDNIRGNDCKADRAAAWILRYDNADYLQFQSVSGSTATCKNGNTVTEANPRCK